VVRLSPVARGRGVANVKLLFLMSVAVVCVALAFVYKEPWIGGVGLLIAFVAMFTDRDDVKVDERGSYETEKSVRNMRSRNR
jgi:NADH:ubiquinone oxidoreductase subunit 6 (subunit J)